LSTDELIPTKPEGKFDEIFNLDCVSDKETRQANLDYAVKTGVPWVQYRKPRKGKVAIVGSGPSATDYIPMLKEWDGEVWGINRAFPWLRHRGVKVDAFVGIDPEWFLLECTYHTEEPHPPFDATYYLAAQVHPKVFDFLSKHNVKLWFAADREVKLPIGAVPVPGGSTALTRAPYLASLLGYEDVHIFGGDSSYTHKTHVHGGELPEKGVIPVVNSGRLFHTNTAMFAQASDMVEIVTNFPGSITIHGDGLMPQMVQEKHDSGEHEQLIAMEAMEMAGMTRAQRRALRR
jgi:hypothetical protein